MTVTSEKKKWFEKNGAGFWALFGVLALLCLVLISGRGDQEEVKTDLEIRMERVIEKMEGVRKANVMIVQEQSEITGVLIVCDGAEEIAVRIRVQNAVGTLLDIENSRISVVPMEGK